MTIVATIGLATAMAVWQGDERIRHVDPRQEAIAVAVYAAATPTMVCSAHKDDDRYLDCLRGAARAAKTAAVVMVEVLDEGPRPGWGR